MSRDRKPRDKLYARRQSQLVDFAFDERVAGVFPDMIRRSVPGYDTVVPLLGLFAETYAQPHSHCYDLGCSLGAATLAMRQRIRVPDCTIVAVDNAEAMARGCRANLDADPTPVPVEVLCADIRDVELERASVVVLNFTLQFLPPEERLGLLQRIRAACLPGAALVLAEKVRFADARTQQFAETMHVAFKQANGYSELEISQKRAALEKVLIPDTLEVHHSRLREAGFTTTHTWFQCFNFAALVALP